MRKDLSEGRCAATRLPCHSLCKTHATELPRSPDGPFPLPRNTSALRFDCVLPPNTVLPTFLFLDFHVLTFIPFQGMFCHQSVSVLYRSSLYMHLPP